MFHESIVTMLRSSRVRLESLMFKHLATEVPQHLNKHIMWQQPMLGVGRNDTLMCSVACESSFLSQSTVLHCGAGNEPSDPFQSFLLALL